MNNDIWIFGAVCYIGGICTVLLPLLAPRVVNWWSAYLDRHQFPQFPLVRHGDSIEEYQRELRMKRDPLTAFIEPNLYPTIEEYEHATRLMNRRDLYPTDRDAA